VKLTNSMCDRHGQPRQVSYHSKWARGWTACRTAAGHSISQWCERLAALLVDTDMPNLTWFVARVALHAPRLHYQGSPGGDTGRGMPLFCSHPEATCAYK